MRESRIQDERTAIQLTPQELEAAWQMALREANHEAASRDDEWLDQWRWELGAGPGYDDQASDEMGGDN